MTRLVELAARPKLFNVTLDTKNQEFSQVLPAGLRKFTIKVRDAKADIKLSFTEGQSGTIFVTIPSDGEYVEDLIHIPHNAELTIYFQTSSASDPVVEIY